MMDSGEKFGAHERVNEEIRFRTNYNILLPGVHSHLIKNYFGSDDLTIELAGDTNLRKNLQPHNTG